MDFMARSLGGLVLGFCFLVAMDGDAPAATSWVEIEAAGAKVRAILAVPEGPGPHPAVIFNHGTGVRQHGYEGSHGRGQMDVKDFTEALRKEGYVALAPIRRFNADVAYKERGQNIGSGEQWAEAVAKGIETVRAAKAFLDGRADVATDRIAVIGFSEGGNVTLWTAAETPGFAAVVLMSPASLRDAGRYWLKNAAGKDNVSRIEAPVFLSLGEDDLRPIRKVIFKRLIPNLKETNPGFEYRTDYPGGHYWFYEVRDEYWPDIAAFLAKHLK